MACGAWLKSKSLCRSPSSGSFSRTSGSGVGPPVGRRVEPLAAEEIVLDELARRRRTGDLMVDLAGNGVGADDHGRHPEAVARGRRPSVARRCRRIHPSRPSEEDRGAVPVGSLHDGIDQPRDVRLTGTDGRRWMLTHRTVRDHPRHGRQGPVAGLRVELRGAHDVPELPSSLTSSKPGSGFQIPGDRGAERVRLAGGGIVVAVRLRTGPDEVLPAHAGAMQQPGQVRPGKLVWSLGARASLLMQLIGLPGLAALGRPQRHEPQVRGQAPAPVRSRTCDRSGRSSWRTPSSWGSRPPSW